MNIGVIFAGGVGTRMRSVEKPKQFLEIYNKPIIIYTLEVFENCSDIDAIVIACVEEWITYLEDLIVKYRISKVKKVVPGGKTGQLSIYNGLCAAQEITKDKANIVLIHDGVRPLINTQLLSDNVNCVLENGSAITCVDAQETVLMMQDDSEDIKMVTKRDSTKMARAPQSFYLEEILSAHEKALKNGKTDYIDSCTLMSDYGKKLKIVWGPRENIKITTPEDYYIMRAFIEAKENKQIYGEK